MEKLEEMKCCCDALQRAVKSEAYPFYQEYKKFFILLLDDANADLGDVEKIPLTFCPFCGKQLWEECPSCRGYGEVERRNWNSDDGGNSETPYISGCARCDCVGQVPYKAPKSDMTEDDHAPHPRVRVI